MRDPERAGEVVRQAGTAARSLAVAATIAWGAGCTLPAVETRLPRSRLDSMAAADAATKGAEWRALHFPAADLHGPFTRPLLGDTAADANDALAYFRLGDSVRALLPGLADRAFYWAARLDPSLAEAYFARWELRARGTPYREYPDGSVHRIAGRGPNDDPAVDSLLFNALVHNPFTDGVLEIPRWIYRLDEHRASADPMTAGMRAYADRDYRKAVNEWAKLLHEERRAARVHLPRAYAWVHLNEADSAIAELTALVDHLERVERDSLVVPYLSKDFLYYDIGILHGRQKRYAAARTAYEQALVENLGFYMAHVRLSAAALLLHDTVTALSEVETATLIRGDDPVVLVYRGSILLGAGRLDDAEAQLRASLHADAEYALPHAYLGLLAERRRDLATARAAYRVYLDHASRTAPERDWVEDRLAHLTTP
jgi:tetratricopeptide (TPR) repeat protein